MTDPRPQAHRNAWIDALRGFAALAVAIFHFGALPSETQHGEVATLWIAFWRHGHFGVPIFFVLSGYCVSYSWLKAERWRDFGWRRGRRILPPYWASLLLVVGVAAATKWLRGANDVTVLPHTALELAATLLLATEPATSVHPINWVYWTLICEAAFYAVLTGLLFRPTGRIWNLVVVNFAFCLAAALHGIPAPGPFFFINYWPLFGLGAALALLPSHRLPGSVMLATLAILLVHEFLRPPPPDLLTLHGRPGWDYLTVALVTAAVVWAADRWPLPRFLAPLKNLGVFSYSLYLVHVPVGIYVISRLFAPPASDARYFAEQAVALAGTLVVAWLFFLCAERPFMNSRRAP